MEWNWVDVLALFVLITFAVLVAGWVNGWYHRRQLDKKMKKAHEAESAKQIIEEQE